MLLLSIKVDTYTILYETFTLVILVILLLFFFHLLFFLTLIMILRKCIPISLPNFPNCCYHLFFFPLIYFDNDFERICIISLPNFHNCYYLRCLSFTFLIYLENDYAKMVVDFSSLEGMLGECPTIHSLPVIKKINKWRLARAH